MGDSKENNRQFPLAGLFAIFAVLSVIFFKHDPFRVSRPDMPEVPEHLQKVQARLWQDPFQAVLDNPDAVTDGPHELLYLCSKETDPEKLSTAASQSEAEKRDALFHAIKRKLGKEGTVTVLGVMVPGAPYAEEREVRIRSRYAAVSALSRLGFAPDDAEHLRYARLALSPNASLPLRTPGMTDVMPYEWFRHGKNRDSILLLWLNDEIFKQDDHPITKLNCLSLNLRQNQERAVPLKIIGPAGGGTLRRMLREARDLTDTAGEAEAGASRAAASEAVAGAKPAQQPAIEMYSPRAAVDDRTLLETLPDRNFIRDPTQCVEERFRRAGLLFKRTICSDRELAEKVFSELKIRGIDCRDSKNHIVLISESDTYYGRSLSAMYTSVFFDKAVVNAGNQIHSFSYIRGIDGKLPIRSGSGGGAKDEKGSEKSKADAAGELERAAGQSQFDYVRRLAEEIHDFEQNLSQGGKIRAIGILGSDFHDKYLVLQALRQRFPQAVFFTTELDARMLHPDALPSTRNLLVASSFDLHLRGDDKINVQGGSPPFRDSYQTSIFSTVLKSFSGYPYLTPDLQRVLESNPQPKIFEIGKTRAVDLSEEPGHETSFDPRPREAANSIRVVTKVIAILLLLALLLAMSSVWVRTLLHSVFRDKKRAFVGTAFIVLLVLSVFMFWRFILLAPHQEEPFSFLEGVSVWPTELLRLLALILCLFFIWQGSSDINRNNRQIARRFGLWRRCGSGAAAQAKETGRVRLAAELTGRAPKARMGAVRQLSPGSKSKTGILSDLQAMLRTFADVTTYAWNVEGTRGKQGPPHGSAPPPQVADYWWEYLRRDSLKYRVRRLAPIMLSYFALCWLIISFGRSEPPVRGPLSIAIDGILLTTSVLAVTTTIFYAFDVIRTCRRFTDLLAERPPKWSERSYRKMIGPSGSPATEPMSEWMLVELIAARTEVVGKLIFYPFIVCFVLICARTNFFDNWQTPIGLLLIICLGVAYAWSCAFVLRRSAEKARLAALDRLVAAQAAAIGRGGDEKQLKPITFAIEAIRSIKSGAFAPFTQNPVVQALMVPFGGVGGVYVVEFLAKLRM